MKHIFSTFGQSLFLCSFLLCGCITEKKANDAFLPVYEGEWSSAPKKTPINKVPDGAICGNGDIGMVVGGTPDNQVLYFSKNDFWKAQKGYPDGGVCYIGQLRISCPSMSGASYQMKQTIADATLKGVFKKEGGASYQLNAWCAANRNIAVIELTATEQLVDFVVELALEEGMGSKLSKGNQESVEWSVRQFEGPDLEWPSAVAVGMKVLGQESAALSLQKGEKATIVLSFCSNHDQEAYVEGAVDLIKNVQQTDLSSLYSDHQSWWNTFWSKSRVQLGDPFLEQYYYGSQYLLACCSRNNSFPPGLWGTSLTMDATANGWAGDYHTNYNHMAPWWGVYSSNHVELSEPYDTPILEYMEKAKLHAKEFLDKAGVYYPVGIGPKGFCSSMFPLTAEAMMHHYNTPETNIEGGYMFLGQKSNAVFCTTNMFMRFYHTYDRSYAEKVYPFIREVADFWEDYLVYENGRYVSYNDNFWEVGPWEGKDYKSGYGDINPTVSLGLCRMLFKGIIDMSQFLQTDAGRVEKWQHILTHLSEIPTETVDGEVRIKACEGGTGSGSRTAPGLGRVMMHGLVFPSGACGANTDAAFAKVLLDEVYRWDTDTINHSYLLKDAKWDNLGNGFETYFTAAARLGYNGDRLLVELKKRIAKTSLPNLWIEQAGGGIETLSAVPSCVNEMLLQGYEGIVRVFPVWPKEKEASFDNLRTHGAFLVSSSCKNGEVQSVTILSEQGRLCKIENPWGDTPCTVIAGNGQQRVFENKQFEVETAVGETIRLVKSNE